MSESTQLSDQSKQLHKAIDFGFQVEAFLGSDIGKYLVNRAESQISEAAEQLKHVEPENATRIRALQHLVHVGEDFQYWLAEAIQAGYAAQDELTERTD